MKVGIPTPDQVAALVEGRCRMPFEILGNHPIGREDEEGRVVRVYLPWASEVSVLVEDHPPIAAELVHESGLFQAVIAHRRGAFPYRLSVTERSGGQHVREDPYRFPPSVDERRVELFLDGGERHVLDVLGARMVEVEGVSGVLFSVWAPHALAVGLVGTMNWWDPRTHPMRPRGSTGVWELFVPDVGVGALYKYQVVTASGQRVDKADPCGRAVELRPATASVVWSPTAYQWGDHEWMAGRTGRDPASSAMSTYEVHLGSWRRTPPKERAHGDHGWLGYRQLADELLPYVEGMGFTHVELLPVLEHPYDQSWGYQPLGFFAPTSRFGTPDDFRYFVDRAHQMGLGVILDWVPGHFPEDAHGLAQFDGTALYEHPDPRRGQHPDWGTRIFDFGKPAVRSFLISSALHWIEDYHLDGLRVDAVASMLYLDYSREEGEWLPNVHGGNENLDAVAFLRELNDAVHEHCPGVVMIAEESTAWPGVSHGTDVGGLGFDQKWNMGWMNDTLGFVETDPLFRPGRYDRLTFSLLYAFSERFVLPLSHDEVVHGKRSLLSRMPGPREAMFANLRVLYAYLWGHPGKKLLFMGGEFGQWTEWNVDTGLDWALLGFPLHEGLRRLVSRLNGLYREEAALHALDFHGDGFEWLDCHDAEHATISLLRWSAEWRDFVAVAVNFTPVPRESFRLPVPFPGTYRVVLNTDDREFGGEGLPIPDVLHTRPGHLAGRDQYLELPLNGLTALYLKRIPGS